MSRFYVSRITASGEKVRPSEIEFRDGVNFIVGPSNTGKSYVIGCIDFMFGAKEIPFARETGYDTVSMEMRSDDGFVFVAIRKIEEGPEGDKGANSVQIYTDYTAIESNVYRISTKEYSDQLLKLIGITTRPRVIATQAPTDEDMTIRSIFHFFFLGEEYIFEKKTPFDTPRHSRITKSLTSLIYLLSGDDLKRFLPEVSVEELEKITTRREGVINYLKQKVTDLTDQKIQLEKSMKNISSEDIDKKIDEIVLEIENTENDIVKATDESNNLLSQIYSYNAKLQEARYLDDQYGALHSQYVSDLKRLNFIVEGDIKGKKIHYKDNCPFCGHTMDIKEKDRTVYVESAKTEAARIRLQLNDLEITENDVKNEINQIEHKLDELNVKNDSISNLLNKKLKPHAKELRKVVDEYRRVQQVKQKIESVSYMAAELDLDVYKNECEIDVSVPKFDAKENFDEDIWKELSNQINKMIKACGYTGKPESHLSLKTADVVVGGKNKKEQGKGYRAFLNTIMLFNLLKYLEFSGKFSEHLLILDSPILSLKENKYEISEKERTTIGMREGLIQYMIDNCGNNQIIIAENELPENVDYSKAHRIAFSMSENSEERYGFLKDVRN